MQLIGRCQLPSMSKPQLGKPRHFAEVAICRNLDDFRPNGSGNCRFFYSHEVLRAHTAYHSCLRVRISLRAPVFFSGAIGISAVAAQEVGAKRNNNTELGP